MDNIVVHCILPAVCPVGVAADSIADSTLLLPSSYVPFLAVSQLAYLHSLSPDEKYGFHTVLS
jgi:hypothetical protein